jgi:DNA modification methylase
MVADDGEIVAGYGRLLAAQHLGLNEVPIIRLSHLTPEQVRAYRIADNRLSELSGWDDELLAAELHALNAAGFDLDLTGFEGDDLARLLAPLDDGDGLAGDDVIPEPPLNPVSRAGDLWLLGDHRLLCGDSTKAEDVVRVINNHKAILFASDPPYRVDYDGTNHPSCAKRMRSIKQGAADCAKRAHRAKNKDWGNSYGITWDDSSQGPELYEGFIKAAIEHAILPNAAWYCWHASRRQTMVESVWEKFGASVHQQIVWAKDRGILTRSYYLWQHEPCFFGWLKGNKPPRVSDDYPGTVWQLPTVKVGECPPGGVGDAKTDHPTSKPVDVFAIPMRQHARGNEVCYEPFSGSGSQIIAGETTGRREFAIEISPQYVDVAVKRWQTAAGKPAKLDGDGRTFDAVAGERLPRAA